jgi:hypothetical protein
VAAAERDLVALYAAASAQHPQLAARLGPIAAEHEAHLQAVVAAAPSPSPSASPTTTVPPSPAPATLAAALAQLATAERTAATARVQDTRTASAPLARLLAGIGAAEAVHVALLAGQR